MQQRAQQLIAELAERRNLSSPSSRRAFAPPLTFEFSVLFMYIIPNPFVVRFSWMSFGCILANFKADDSDHERLVADSKRSAFPFTIL